MDGEYTDYADTCADYAPVMPLAEDRDTINTFCRQARELGIVDRLITAEEYFAEYLGS